MTAPNSAKLYTPRLLSLATQLARYPLTDNFALLADARSKTCGSTIAIGLSLDEDENVAGIGLQVSACAVGQAASAIMAEGIIGCSRNSIAETAGAMERWLEGGERPQWQGLEALEPALDHPGRFGALLLPWHAAMRALSLESEPS